ncbi:MAG: cyclodeaminase/cyclohydrolase family protein, partial [Bacteroidales bacterium]
SLEQFQVPEKAGEVRFHDLGLPDRIMHAIADLGFQYCTPIQAKTLTHAVIEAMVEKGNPNSISDAGVGGLALHACIEGAWLNVRINSKEMADDQQVRNILKQGEQIRTTSVEMKDELLQKVLKNI